MNVCPHCQLRRYGTCPLLAQGIVCPHCQMVSGLSCSGVMDSISSMAGHGNRHLRYRPMSRQEAKSYFLPDNSF